MTKAEIVAELKLRYVTKEELAQMLGATSERTVRMWIEQLNAELKTEYSCVLSTGRKAGYHIPNPYDATDVEEANAILAELKKKAISIFDRRQAIENFVKYSQSADAARGVIQPTLF